VLTASIIRTIHGALSQKAVTFIPVRVFCYSYLLTKLVALSNVACRMMTNQCRPHQHHMLCHTAVWNIDPAIKLRCFRDPHLQLLYSGRSPGRLTAIVIVCKSASDVSPLHKTLDFGTRVQL
jgi:hypothetical protein